jgi:hypothetical protein
LSKANTFTGGTIVGAGTLALVGPGNLVNSEQIVVSNSAVLDVTGRNDQTLTLNSGVTLRGSGTVLGNLNALGGSIINPGDGIGTLVVQSNVTLAGAIVMELNRAATPANDKLISTNGAIFGGGTLTVTNLGASLQAGDYFQLFSQPVSGFVAVNLPALAAGNTWQNNLGADGSIRVVSTSAVTFTMGAVVGGRFTLAWPADHTGWQLQVQTNGLATGLSTNWFNVPNTAMTNQVTQPLSPQSGGVFFRLVYP